jgi:hypothetical protein
MRPSGFVAVRLLQSRARAPATHRAIAAAERPAASATTSRAAEEARAQQCTARAGGVRAAPPPSMPPAPADGAAGVAPPSAVARAVEGLRAPQPDAVVAALALLRRALLEKKKQKQKRPASAGADKVQDGGDEAALGPAQVHAAEFFRLVAARGGGGGAGGQASSSSSNPLLEAWEVQGDGARGDPRAGDIHPPHPCLPPRRVGCRGRQRARGARPASGGRGWWWRRRRPGAARPAGRGGEVDGAGNAAGAQRRDPGDPVLARAGALRGGDAAAADRGGEAGRGASARRPHAVRASLPPSLPASPTLCAPPR